jgi:tetratricopeptide (TPR) repeat protein
MSRHCSQAADGNRVLAIVVGGILLTLAFAATAAKPSNITNAEMALLPEYCADTQGFKYGDASYNTSPNAPKWVGLMGLGFWHMHHYCWALINLGRAQKPSMPASLRQSAREYAIDDMQYVIANTTSDFIMLPEIYTKIGEVLVSLNRPQEAHDAFAKARSLKPDYWPPYFQWATHLRQTGQKVEARQLVEEGLSLSPGAKPLQNLLVELGGDPKAVAQRTRVSTPQDPAITTGPPTK